MVQEYGKKTAAICLFFQLAVIPLLIHPFAFDIWYGPKIEATYGLVAVLLLTAGALKILARTSLALPPRPVVFFLGLYALSACLSTAVSVDRRLSLQGDFFRRESMATLLAYAALPLVFSALVFSGRQARRLLQALAVCTVLVAAYPVLQFCGLRFLKLAPFWGLPVMSGITAPGGTLGNANFLGKFLVLTAPLLGAFVCTGAGRTAVFLRAGAFATACAALILTETRSSWFSFCLAGCLFLATGRPAQLLTRKHRRSILAGAALSAAALAGLLALPGGTLKDVRQRLAYRTAEAFEWGKLRETSTRLFLWEKAVDQIALRPWLGYGPDTHVLVMRQYNAEYIRRFGAKVLLDRVHNNYLDIALAQGLVGLGAYCGIVASFLLWLWRVLRREASAEKRLFLAAVFSGFCGCLFNDFFSFSAVSVSPTFWSLMGLTFALQRLWAAGDTAQGCV